VTVADREDARTPDGADDVTVPDEAPDDAVDSGDVMDGPPSDDVMDGVMDDMPVDADAAEVPHAVDEPVDERAGGVIPGDGDGPAHVPADDTADDSLEPSDDGEPEAPDDPGTATDDDAPHETGSASEAEPVDELVEGPGEPARRDPLDLSVPMDELDPLPDDDESRHERGDDVDDPRPGPREQSFDDVVQAPGADSPAAGGRTGPDADGTGASGAATGWGALGRAMRPRLNRSQALAALLCGALGFALVVQVQQSAQDPLSSARQDDLVRLLDEVTQRAEQLDDEVAELTRTRDELASGTGQAQAAVDLAEQRAESEGILSGRLPAVGPGLEIVVRDPSGAVPAAKLFNILEELRNAGAEVVELNDVRIVTSSWFLDTDAGVTVDGQAIDSPYRWTVIGDPATLNPALEIPGGALAQIRSDVVDARVQEQDEVEITATREPVEPQYATPHGPEE
jgi:uncharacterized protein YlxW (UPF0749 family)